MSNLFDQADKHWRYRPLLLLVVLFVGVFLYWAAVTEIDQQVRAMGRVIPAGKTKAIQHLEGGIVEAILVEEGQKVSPDEVLFYIANKDAEAELKELKIGLKALEIKQARLQAEMKGDGELPDFSEHQDPAYFEIIESERQLFKSRHAEFSQRVDGLAKRMQQKVFKLDELQSNVKNLHKELQIAQEQLGIQKKLRKTGAVSRSQYLEVESEVKNFLTRIDKIQKEIPITKTELAELVNLLEETKQNWNSTVVEELQSVKLSIKKFYERIQSLNDQVTRTAVRSPINGIINKRYINTIGGVVQPGETLAEMLPIDETLVVEGRIPTDDRGKVWPGLPVVAKITAYDYSIYGGVKGTLTYISANSFIDNQNQEYYQARVTLETNELDEAIVIYPGMTADLNILTGKMSVLHALLRPFWRIRENAMRGS